MTVPFGPRVLPTARSQMGAGERFLDTATRAFEEAAGFVEAQRESRRRQQEFESEQEFQKLRSQALAEEIEQRSQAAIRERAMDPRFVKAEEPASRVQAPASRIPEGQAYQTPFPEAQAPAGAQLSDEIAGALAPPGGLRELAVGPMRPELRPTGVPGEFYDPTGEQRAAQRQLSQAGGQVRDLLNSLAQRQAQQGNTAMADRIRGEIENVVAQVEAGNNPAQVVRGVLDDLRQQDERTSRIAFLKQQVGQDVPENLETLSPEDQIAELERIQEEQTIAERERRRAGERPPTRQTGQLTETQIVGQVRAILEQQGIAMADATDDQIAAARAQVLRVARPGERPPPGTEGVGEEEQALENTRAQATRVLARIVAAAERRGSDEQFMMVQRQAQTIREQIATGDLEQLRAIVRRMLRISEQLP